MTGNKIILNNRSITYHIYAQIRIINNDMYSIWTEVSKSRTRRRMLMIDEILYRYIYLSTEKIDG